MSVNTLKDGKIPFEEALDKTGYGLYSYLMIALGGATSLSFLALAYGSTIIVPTSACELATTSAQQGLLVAVPIAGTVPGSLLWGYLGDTRGRRRMLLASLALGAVFNALASISVNWIMLMIIQLFTVIFASGIYVLSMTLLNESVPLLKRNVATLLVTSVFLIGQGVISVMAIPIIPLTFSYYMEALGIYWNSWRTLQALYSLPALLCAVWTFFMQESPKFVFARGNEGLALRILENIHRINHGRRRERLQVEGLLQEQQELNSVENKSGVKEQLLPLFTKPYLKITMIMACLSILLQIIEAFLVWAPNIANQLMELLQAGEGKYFTLCQIIATEIEDDKGLYCSVNSTAMWLLLAMCSLHSVVTILLSWVVNSAGRRNMAIGVTLVSGVAGVLVNLVSNAVGSALLFLVFTTGVVVMGCYMSITISLFPTHLRSMAVATTMTGTRIMSVAFIQMVNYLLVNACALGFYVCSAVFTTSALVLALLPDDRRLPAPEDDCDPQEGKVVVGRGSS